MKIVHPIDLRNKAYGFTFIKWTDEQQLKFVNALLKNTFFI